MARRNPLARLGAALVPVVALVALVAAGCGGMVSTSEGQPQGGVAVADAGTPATPGAQRHIIYLSEFSISTILERLLPTGPGPLEQVQVFRQMPAAQTVLQPAYRIARLDGVTLAKLPAEEIARRIRTAVDTTCTKRMPCTSHLVSIDDIGVEFRGDAGKRLNDAMAQLQDESPWGSTYADRVVMYIPIQMIEGIMAGGDEAAAWGGALSAVAKGESYWLEMYPDFSRDVDYRMWTEGTKAISDAITSAGGELSRVHFMVGDSTGRIAGMPKGMCVEGRGCAWVAARANDLNRSISANGVGFYRLGPGAIEVLCVQTVAEKEAVDAKTWKIVKGACAQWLRTGERPGS